MNATDPTETAAAVLKRSGPMAGTRLGRYKIWERIGQGGSANVYLVSFTDNTKSGKSYEFGALKLYKEESATRGDTRRAARREAKFLKRLSGLRVPKPIDTGSSPWGNYVVMDHIEGFNITQLVKKNGPFKRAEGAELIADFTETLVEGHERGVVLGDVTRNNVMVTSNGDVYAFDMDRASREGKRRRLGADGIVNVTLGYASPQAAKGKGRTAAADDIFSAGSLAFFAVTGKEMHEFAVFEAKPLPQALLEWYGRGGLHADEDARARCREFLKDDYLFSIILHATEPDPKQRIAGFQLTNALRDYAKTLRYEQREASDGPAASRGRHAAAEPVDTASSMAAEAQRAPYVMGRHARQAAEMAQSHAL